MTSGEKKKTALVVDDEVFARLFATQILEDEGFETLEAGSTVEALDVLDTTDNVSLLITDVSMPGDQDGLALARKVAQTYPHVRTIIVSGVVQLALSSRPSGSEFLSKPYTAHGLMSLVRQLRQTRGTYINK